MARCTKVRYRDEIAARLVLAQIQRKDKPGHENHHRAYKCHLCRGWHTTSKEYREPNP
jgi:hypothetical protein